LCVFTQPLDMSQLLSGKEPLLKLQLTHCSDGGSILAATVPHLLVGESLGLAAVNPKHILRTLLEMHHGFVDNI
jgi:hypothetical protein